LKIFRRYFSYRQKKVQDKTIKTVESILSGNQDNRHNNDIDPELLFNSLQSQYTPRDGYKYDHYHTWLRGVNRVKELLSIPQLQKIPIEVLEFACGDGMTGKILSDYGHLVTHHDLQDWRDERARNNPFVEADLVNAFPIEDASYDFIFSYNSFEHIPDPSLTFRELIRLSKPNGLIYLEFGPLYASPWGLHAYKTMYMPYPQYLFSESFILKKLQELGINDLGQQLDTLQPLNKWKLSDFTNLWMDDRCEILHEKHHKDLRHLDIIEKYPNAFNDRGLKIEDVTTQAISVLLRKKGI
jgi:SAM-dependent methyltransferase